MDGLRLGHSRGRVGVVTAAAVTAAMCWAAGVSVAQTGGTTETTTSTTTTTADGTATDTSADSGGPGGATKGGGGSTSIQLMGESAAPGKAYFYGDRRIVYEYTIDGNRSKNLKIQAVRRRDWKTVKVWRRDNVEPGTHKVRWNGITSHGKAARKGAYLFRVRTMKGNDIDRSRAKGDDRSVKLYPEKFPVRARHTYGDGYGAPRSGHVHQGQDILAKCAKPVVAARGGRVQYSGYQAGGAGYYVVIDGRSNGHDYVYMHLRKRGPREGSHVHTGETIGRVGRTGDASGCHLHFEMWSRPGWYEGGHAMPSVTKHLKKWDRWS
jgi:murein DD-endopeptidase MepM/ murein hydrolase activator NlpD